LIAINFKKNILITNNDTLDCNQLLIEINEEVDWNLTLDASFAIF
jgi:hypothetical protein